MWTGLLVLGYVQLENESMTVITTAHGKGKKGKNCLAVACSKVVAV